VGQAATLLELARSRPPTLGAARLVCIDGPAGSGKTTLAAGLTALEPGARVLHMDDLYEGWQGLAKVSDQLGELLRPLADGRAGSYRRYDWHAGRFVETVVVEPLPLLVIEGVGSAARAHADLVTALAWVEAPWPERLRRGLERDGEAMRPEWEQWQVDEAALFEREGTRGRADLIVDTSP
jgi:uridine kinase